MLDVDVNSWVVVLFVAAIVAVGVIRCRDQGRPALRGPPLLDGSGEDRISSLLLLGPSGSGKTELYCAAVALSGEGDAGCAAGPTRGLVRRTLTLPTTPNATVGERCLLCDAGGGLSERRQWVALVKGEAVGTVIFVATVYDESDDTLFLFKQLAHAPWSQRATLILALTHIDEIIDLAQRRALCDARSKAFRSATNRSLSVHSLDARDQASADVLLRQAAAGVALARNSRSTLSLL